MRRRGRDEVGGNELRALVHELVERVLPVRARGAPDDRLRAEFTSASAVYGKWKGTYAGLVVDALAALGDELAVRLHVALLEVVRELVQILVIR